MSDRLNIAKLAAAGIIFPASVTSVSKPAAEFAMDAASLAPTMIGVSNAGIPAWLTTFVDPRVIEALVAPMAAAQLLGEVKKGDWTTSTAMFIFAEPTGQVATYGDWSPNGRASANVNFPTRQNYLFQTWTEWGDRELALAGEARIDWAARQDAASALIMAKFLNRSYLLGVDGLPNYGLMNDPNLTAPVASTVNWATASPEDIANAMVTIVGRLVANSQGLITGQEVLRAGLPPTALNDINRTNNFGLSAYKKIMETYPKLEFVPVPEFDTGAGRLIQVWAPEVQGQPAGEVAYSEKMRAHSIERYSTYQRQKKSAGTFGAVIYLPLAVTQTIGI